MFGFKPWQTWIAHGLVASLVTFLFSFAINPYLAAAFAVWGYAFRELDQLTRYIYRGRKIPVLDQIMDVVFPLAFSFALAHFVL